VTNQDFPNTLRERDLQNSCKTVVCEAESVSMRSDATKASTWMPRQQESNLILASPIVKQEPAGFCRNAPCEPH